MRGSLHHRRPFVLALCCAVILALMAPIAFAADPPVKAAVTFAGAKTPGSTNTAKAVLTISDGSTFQSMQWKQTSGPTVVLANALTDTVTITLPDIVAFRSELVKYLHDSPLTTSQLPSYYPPGREFEGGLQERWSIAGVYPTPIANASAIKFELTVVTTSGTYKLPVTVSALLPYAPASASLRNVPVGKPVLLHGKTQDTYD